jgi:D-sedoheptulose 7-phosphate isomerase
MSIFEKYITKLNLLFQEVNLTILEQISKEITSAILQGRTIFVFGNGGSASIANHFATDLVGGVSIKSNNQVRVISLSANSSLLTAISNDFGNDQIFSRQLESHATKNDLVVAVSSSGKSPNIISALKLSREMGLRSVALVGFSQINTTVMESADHIIHVKCADGLYEHVEDVHSILCHVLKIYITDELRLILK